MRQIPSLIGKIPMLGFTENWSADYAQFPYAFIAFLALIGLLWFWQHRTQVSLKSEMRRAWHHLSGRGREHEDLDKIGALRNGLAIMSKQPLERALIQHSDRAAQGDPGRSDDPSLGTCQ